VSKTKTQISHVFDLKNECLDNYYWLLSSLAQCMSEFERVGVAMDLSPKWLPPRGDWKLGGMACVGDCN